MSTRHRTTELFQRNRAICATLCISAAFATFTAAASSAYTNPLFNVTFNTSRTHIAPGDHSDIQIEVRDSQGKPVQYALIDIGAGGGQFAGAGDRFHEGRTDQNGRFSARWISQTGNYSIKYVIDFRIYLGDNLVFATNGQGPLIEVLSGPTCGTQNPSASKMTVHTAVGSRKVTPGSKAAINVWVEDENGRRVKDATVTISFGGGYFPQSNSDSITGKTNEYGIYAQWWRTASPEVYASDFTYVYTVQATAPGYEPATTNGELVVELEHDPKLDPDCEIPQGSAAQRPFDRSDMPGLGSVSLRTLTGDHGGAFRAERQSSAPVQYPGNPSI